MPNGLLESCGNNGFQVPCARTFVRRPPEHVAPLLMITTNEERELPAAFLRRCIVLHMKLPDSDSELTTFLIGRGRDHCSQWIDDDAVYSEAAEQLLRDRRAAREAHSPVLPGPAEYLDLLYAVGRLHPGDADKQKKGAEGSEGIRFSQRQYGPRAMNSHCQELPARIAGTLTNRADLLLALAAHGPLERAAVAADCGFEPTAIPEDQPPAPPVVAPPPSPAKRSPPKPAAVPAELKWLRTNTYRRIEDAGMPPEEVPEEIGDRPIGDRQLDARPYRVKPRPLQPWSRLWPWLHHVHGQLLPGRQLDLPRLIDQIANRRPVRRLPFRRRLTWAPKLHILVDGDRSMDQFRDDIYGLLARLRQCRGSEGFHCRLLPTGPAVLTDPDALTDPNTLDRQAPNISPGGTSWISPEAGDTVLVLGDLGCLDRSPHRIADWLGYGRYLQRRGVARFALSPCPRDRWDFRLAHVWACSPWDHHQRLPRGRRGCRPASAAIDSQQRERMLEALLRIASVALLIESPLLREMRSLLPDADAGLEHDLRSHPEVHAVAGVCALKPQYVDRRMGELITGDDEFLKRLKERFPELLRRHHQPHGALLCASETYNLHAAKLGVAAEELARAQAVFRAGNRTRWDEIDSTPNLQRPADRQGFAAWNAREVARRSSVRAESDRELAAASALEAVASGGTAQPPEGFDQRTYEKTLQWALDRHRQATPRTWQLRQHGQTLRLESPNEVWSAGTPLARVDISAPVLSLTFDKQTGDSRVYFRPDRQDGRRCPLGMPQHVSLASNCCQVDLESVRPPDWASRFGWDRFGLFADFEVGGVTFALRWIPPGEFQMGSPEGEPGRIDEREGPRHRVTIGQGFWMASTPVTQAQYAAVTGQRPSRFKNAGDRAPVESVSWADCRLFCGKLQEEMIKLDKQAEQELTAGLPSEAQWEYACRAGTDSALYTGPLTILGDCNGPELDAIAWYGGNSGVDYEGAENSSMWPDKQYEHRRAGTHPVGAKQPNPWGLYDMLGNVWEWCEDPWHDKYEGAPDDGTVWADNAAEGGNRVLRGGSWASRARDRRCACRNWWPPDRRVDLGFRFVFAARFNEDIRRFP